MSFATRMQALATRLTEVTVFGNSADFSHPSNVYNRSTGTVTVGTPTTLSTTIGGPIGVSPKLADGTLIFESDQVITVEASRLTFTIVPGQTTVTINSQSFAIVSVTPARVNDTDVAYRMVIR